MAQRRRLAIELFGVDLASPAIRKVSSSLKSLAAIAGVGVGAVALGRQFVQGVKAATAAAATQEAANVRLAQSVRNAGLAVGENTAKLRAQAGALERLTGVGDEAIQPIQAMFLEMGVGVDRVDEFTRAAFDLSATGMFSLEGAAKNLGKTMSGLTGELGEAIPGLRNLTKEQLQAGEAAQVVADLFGGQAAAKAQTFSGTIDRLNTVFGTLLENIGGPLIEVAKEFIDVVLIPWIDDANQAIEGTTTFRDTIIDLGIVMATVLRDLAELGPRIKRALSAEGFVEELAKAGAAVSGLGYSAVLIGDPTRGPLSDVGKRLDELLKRLLELKENGPESFEETTEAAKKFDEAIEVSTGKLLSQSEAIRSFVEAGAKGARAQMEAGDQEVERLGLTMDRTFRQVGVNAATSFGDALVDAAERGQFSFRDFARSVLQDMARMFTQALALRAVLGLTGLIGGGAAAGAAAGGGGGLIGVSLGGGLVGYQHGGVVTAPGAPRGRDSLLALVSPGERVLTPAQNRAFEQLAARGGTVTNYYIDARGAAPGVEARILDAMRLAEERAVARSVRTVPEQVMRGGIYRRAFAE